MNKEHLENIKNVWDILQSIMTIAAIIVGGIWTYTNFVEQRENHPRLGLSLAVSDIQISPKYNLLIANENVTNLGSRLIRLRAGEIRVIRVSPVPDEVKADVEKSNTVPPIESPRTWQVLNNNPRQDWGENDHVIEPGENDQIRNEILVPVNVNIVEVFAYVYNPTGNAKKPLGWSATALYDLRRHSAISGEPKASSKNEE